MTTPPVITSANNQSASQELSRVRLAIVSPSLQQRKHLHKVLDGVGVKVVLNEPLAQQLLDKLDSLVVDVVLLDLHDQEHENDSMFEELLERIEVPILFNDVSVLTLNEPRVLAKWYGKLLRKIAESTGQLDFDSDSIVKDYGELLSTPATSYVRENIPTNIARNVWVLGASLGGPEAVKQFLSVMPADVPIAFILTQHLGANFVSLLANQLNEATQLSVITPYVGHVLRHGEVMVTPAGERVLINPIGTVELQPIMEEQQYSPSINLSLEDVAMRYGHKSGAIIFTGMGDDGVAGCQKINEKGGFVWVQDSESCVVSSMPDLVNATGIVSFQGTPEKLAEKLYDLYKES